MNGEESSERSFLDSNIWLYAFITVAEEPKHSVAQALIQRVQPVISTQVINEVCVNLLRKTSLQEPEISELVEAFYSKYQVISLSRDILVQASMLRQRYSLSFWDSLIVSSALASGVTHLYSEDMQHNLLVEQRLRIVNPFIEATAADEAKTS